MHPLIRVLRQSDLGQYVCNIGYLRTYMYTDKTAEKKMLQLAGKWLISVDCKINETNLMNSYPPTKGYLRETCKSQNINPIYLNLKFTFGIIQIITNACQV